MACSLMSKAVSGVESRLVFRHRMKMRMAPKSQRGASMMMATATDCDWSVSSMELAPMQQPVQVVVKSTSNTVQVIVKQKGETAMERG